MLPGHWRTQEHVDPNKSVLPLQLVILVAAISPARIQGRARDILSKQFVLWHTECMAISHRPPGCPRPAAL